MDDCIEWEGNRRPNGYGRIHGRGAHRVMWERARGPIPDGMVIMHTCDNKACINLDHLRCGTQADNMADMRAKMRGDDRKGEAHHLHKVTEADVQLIRATPPYNGMSRDLANRYGITPRQVRNIRSGHSWAHI